MGVSWDILPLRLLGNFFEPWQHPLQSAGTTLRVSQDGGMMWQLYYYYTSMHMCCLVLTSASTVLTSCWMMMMMMMMMCACVRVVDCVIIKINHDLEHCPSDSRSMSSLKHRISKQRILKSLYILVRQHHRSNV